MTDPIQDDGSRDDNINDQNPEDQNDPDIELPDTSDAEALPYGDQAYGEGLYGSSGYPTTYPILEQIISYFPNRSHVYVTSTTGGTHATHSYHYRGEAIDVGSASQVYKDQLAAWLYPHYGYITELIHSKSGNHTGWYVKNGKKVSHAYYGSATTAAHVNHVHFAIASVASANALLAYLRKTHSGGFPGTLKRGSTGNAVRQLQTKLGVHVDGSFGPATEAAVKKFQTAHHLHVDGIVGPTTWNAIF